ncbi:MAG: hypothetical protein AAGF12_26865 [Myxococcota bacterium]
MPTPLPSPSLRWSVPLGCLLMSLGSSLAPNLAAANCEHEDALARAAAELALDHSATPRRLQRALRHAGSDLPQAALLKSEEGSPALQRWLTSIGRSAPGTVVCGQAATSDGILTVAALRAGRLRVTNGAFEVELDERYRDAHLVIVDAEGAHLRLRADVGRPVRIPTDLPRPLDVQLVASDRSGPRPLSQLRVGGPANLGRPGSDRGRERIAELRLRELLP